MPLVPVKQINVPTKGDLISTNGTLTQVLGVGTDGQILSADSGETTGLKWINTSAVDTENQESVTTEAITADGPVTDTLNATPQSNASVSLFLNGVHQEQGAGKDYTISGTTITWLPVGGTAVDMATTDVLIATYVS